MKGFSRVLFCMTVISCLPLVAGAAGTYYNGNLYQHPQRYSMGVGNNDGGFYNNYGAGRGYGQDMQGTGIQKTTTVQTTKKTMISKTESQRKSGFYAGLDLRHEFANWDFEMQNAGSELHYKDLRWNVISGDASYYFAGNFPVQINVGARYGIQYGESEMIDDDITNGGTWVGYTDGTVEGTPALSVGTSKGGKQYGFNAGIGFTNLFDTGRLKMTPSVGYRYFKYEVETKNNYGMMMQVLNSPTLVNCLEVAPGEFQCSPYVGFSNDGVLNGYAAGFALTDEPNVYLASEETDIYGNTIYVLLNSNGTYVMANDMSANQLDLGSSYYYEQMGVSHSYEVEWTGPYVALDMEYQVNDNNVVNAGIEFGLPKYNAKGNQPYRPDWAHPTSVEDEGDLGDAWHIGLNAVWSTAVTDSVMLSLGMTYDYYHVSGATATTYLNERYYRNMVEWGLKTQEEYDYWDAKGWKDKSDDEIDSVYKSMGMRLGLNVKF